jgi:hypothetical protein
MRNKTNLPAIIQKERDSSIFILEDSTPPPQTYHNYPRTYHPSRRYNMFMKGFMWTFLIEEVALPSIMRLATISTHKAWKSLPDNLNALASVVQNRYINYCQIAYCRGVLVESW